MDPCCFGVRVEVKGEDVWALGLRAQAITRLQDMGGLINGLRVNVFNGCLGFE